MKINLLVLSLFLFKYSFSQINVNDIGKKTFYEVKNAFSVSPCEVKDKAVLTYCIENGSKNSFIFTNQVLDGIIIMTAFSSQYAAEKDLEYEISRETSSLGIKPFITGGKTFFSTPESPIFVTYSVEYINRTYYMVHSILKQL
jgi:hypothetical protein